ncbi:hypothetical protein FRB95_009709 [Tulasnella sp. JGI-2019a]|nr:hypothetical protein FRB95_009709 [Tulasnella sp. JGI-2019a]
MPFHFVDPSIGYHDPLINFLCLEVMDLAEGSQRPLDQRVRDVWLARDGTNVLEYITKTIVAHDRHISEGVDRNNLLQYHTEVLRSYRPSHAASVWSPRSGTAIKMFIQHLSRAIIHCHPTPTGQEPTHTPVRSDGSWGERLSRDPLVPVATLQSELVAYGTQLLLCLGSPSLNDVYIRNTPEEADALVDSISKVQTRIVTDTDVMHALHAIDNVISRQDDTLGNNPGDLTHHFDSVSPIVTRALESISDVMSDAVCGVLAAFGGIAWENTHTPNTIPGLLLEPQFASVALQSLEMTHPKDWSSHKDEALARGLAASVRVDATLVTSLDESTVTSLFVSRLSGTKEETYHLQDEPTRRNITFVSEGVARDGHRHRIYRCSYQSPR